MPLSIAANRVTSRPMPHGSPRLVAPAPAPLSVSGLAVARALSRSRGSAIVAAMPAEPPSRPARRAAPEPSVAPNPSATSKPSPAPSPARPAPRPADWTLAPDDPPAFELVNGEGRAPVLFLCDHASNAVPRALGGLGLDEAVLRLHVAWDIGAAEVARRLALRFDAPLVLSGHSRLVIDCNRRPGRGDSIPEASDGLAIPGNERLSDAEAARREALCFRPYHAAIQARLDAFRAAGTAPAILSIHSFTPVFGGAARPWHVGVLWNRDPRIPVPLMAALRALPEVEVGDNEPYDARDDHGYSVKRHAEEAGLPHALVEIRQDLIDTQRGADEWAGRIGDALAPILANRTLYRRETHEP